MPMKRTKSYVDLSRRTSPAKHVSRFLASLDTRLWSYAAGALGLATLTDALRHVARHAVLLLAGAVGTAAYRYGRDGRGGRARLRGSAPPLSALPGDVLSVAVGFLDGCDLLRCGEAGRALSRVCLDDPRPWDMLTRSLRSAAPAGCGAVAPRRRGHRRAFAFFDEATSLAERLAAAAPPGRAWLAIDGRAVDVTDFADQHPGGGELLLEFAGRDASLAYASYPHSFFARDLLDRFVAFDPSAVVGVRRHARRGNGDGGAALATMAKFGVVAGRLRRSGAG